MKIDRSFLRSKVARRIFILFVLCALVPISVLSLLSYIQVSEQLKKQSIQRLYSSAKTHGMSIYERLLFLKTDLDIVAATIKDKNSVSAVNMKEILGDHGTKRFTSLALIKNSGRIEQIYGKLKEFPVKLFNKSKKTDKEKPSIIFQDNKNLPAAVYMVINLDQNSSKPDRLLGQIDISYLWGIGYENMLPPMTGLCIINQLRKVLISSFQVSDALLNRVMMKNDKSQDIFFQYDDGKQSFYVSYWLLFVKSGFNAPNITIILRRNKTDVLSPIANFTKIFPLVVLLSIWIVLLLSIYHIRKSLVPLEKLKKGTQRVAQHDFKSQVTVKSNDEFEDLADSFNLMSRQLGRHFEALTTRSEIDRAILSSLSVKKIVNTALKRMYHFFSCDSISINIAIEKKPTTYHSYILTDVNVRKTEEEFFNITHEDEQLLTENLKYLSVDLTNTTPTYLAQTAMKNMKSFLVLPLFLNKVLKGTIALGFKDAKDHMEDDLTQARQIADQLTVALSNSALVAELEKLNLGTLEALARTVDAKSTWTAGHSERVASLSLKIGTILGLNQKQLDTLQRGAFLHDIGKIGTKLSILDKPGKLTDEEFEKIKEHPVIGARILEPIAAYADVIPMILQHHEQYDGKGYPHGIKGEDISLGARILAVADVYDALISDRPYRHGWIEENVVKMITQKSGNHFDPKVVDAFLAAIS